MENELRLPSEWPEGFIYTDEGGLTPEQVEQVLDLYTVGKVAFTMKAYKATAFYDKVMEKEEAALKSRGGQLSKKDIKRLNAMDKIRESVQQMRGNMYEKEMQRKKEAMRKKCEEKMQSMKPI